MKISIVIPTYNESENLPKIVPQIFKYLDKKESQIIVVDDNSPDNTSNVALKLSKKYPIIVIKRSGRLGLGTAYITGFKEAIKRKSDLIFSMDADLSHNPKYLPNFIKQIQKGNDVVLGSRYIKEGGVVNWNLRRRIMSKGANFLARFILSINTHDVTTGYRCYKRKVLETIGLDSVKSDGYSFLEEILYLCKKNNFKIGETPIVFYDRVHGKSKIRKREMIKFLITLFRLRLFK